MTTREQGAPASGLSFLPSTLNRDQVAVAAAIGTGALLIYALRKGMRGIGPVELTGSMIGATEWFAYLLVVGGTIRVLQTQFPDSAATRAMSFIF